MMCLESDGVGTGGDSHDCIPGAEDGALETLSGGTVLDMKSPTMDMPGLGEQKASGMRRARVAAAGILSVGNVLNYLDRYTVAGVLLDIQQHFGVKDSGAGLLQTVSET